MTRRTLLTLLFALAAGLGHAPAVLALTCTSVGSSNWSLPATWTSVGNCNRVPINGDDVVISAGTTTLDVNSNTLASLTVNGTLTIGNNATGRALIVTGNIAVAGTGTISLGAAAATHTLTAGGDITNAGTINFRPSATRLCNVTFNRNGNQTVSGAGAYTFNLITLNMGATNANVLDMQSAMTTPSPFLTITNGTYKQSSPSNIIPWTTAAGATIPATGGFWLNSAATVTTTGFNVTINGGYLRISSGTMNIGNANTTRLVLNNVATTLFQMDGGTLTVTGGINSATNASTGTFTMSGGTINLMTLSAGAVYSLLLGSATTLNWSGGTIIASKGNAAADDVDIRTPIASQNVTGGTLQMGSGPTSGNNISMINGAGGQLKVWNLVINQSNANTILMRSSTNVLNDLTINTLNTLTPNAGLAINIGAGNTSGNWTNNGTFTQGTSTVTFTGTSAAPAIGGTTATTFNNLAINKASNNLTINTTPTVNGTLTFTSGKIVTGANRVILGAAATVATPSATSYVVGAIQKNYNAGANLGFFAGNDFPVGDAANYTPVDITAGTTTTAGNLTVTTTATDHPQVTTPIASTGINAAKSVNRYWRFANAGLTVGTAITSALTFVAGDIDAGATTANFIVERYDGTNWNPTALGAANPLNTQASNITPLAAGNNDFAVGEPLSGVTAVPGLYNVFETSTPAGAILGKIQTKITGTAFSLDIVHINATKTGVSPVAITVEVRLLDSSSGGALDVNGCSAGNTWPLIQAQPNFNIPASGRGTIPAVTVNNSFRDVRFQIRSPVGGPYTQIGCSTDRFAIRPQSITIAALDQDWQTAGTTRALSNIAAVGGNVHKAATALTTRPFTLRATPVPATATNYNGSPTTVAGFPTCTGLGAVCTNPGGLTYTAGSWVNGGVAGVRENATANYSEAGAFNLQLEDAAYASVDTVDGTPAATLTVPATATAQIGRFVPDHFDVTTLVAPVFRTFNVTDAACSAGAAPRRTFTYIGQPFGYATRPQATIIARNAAGTTTANYRGTLWKIGGAGTTAKNCTTAPDTNTCVYTTTFGATGGTVTETYTYSLVPIATPGWDNGAGAPVAASVASNNDGTGTITYASSDLLAFQRSITTPQAAFIATINNTINVSDNAEGAGQIIATSSPAAFNAIAFDAGNEFRYGRLRLQNANGSQLLPMVVPIQTQYWNGSGFVTNTLDNCTTVAAANVALGNYQKNLNAGETTVTTGGAFAGGVGTLRLSAPGSANNGSVDVAVNLTGGAAGASCTPGMPASTGANLTHLQGAWCGATYVNDPTARATFGVYRGADQFIYQRENF